MFADSTHLEHEHMLDRHDGTFDSPHSITTSSRHASSASSRECQDGVRSTATAYARCMLGERFAPSGVLDLNVVVLLSSFFDLLVSPRMIESSSQSRSAVINLAAASI
ncbi:hypothetical protein [Paraburkholderia sp. GAS348]|uniref:hypothetical protein n=1 Tax=Paraburkholderia sp. GAS348 TaxID=3035132 RepID=UPI003D1E409D